MEGDLFKQNRLILVKGMGVGHESMPRIVWSTTKTATLALGGTSVIGIVMMGRATDFSRLAPQR